METSNPFLVASSASLTANSAEIHAGPNPAEIHAGPQQELSDPSRPIAVMTSERRLEAFEHVWEEWAPKFTAAECSAMSLQQLHQLCEEAYTALDAEFPAWGARDDYEVLCAEFMARAEALRL